jgi:serine/threonine protein kinase
MMLDSAESVDDLHFSSTRRTTTWFLKTSEATSPSHNEPCDVLALVTAIADLYTHEDVLEMQVRIGAGDSLDNGMVSQVSTATSQYTRPSQLVHTEVQESKRLVVIKKSANRLWSTVTGGVHRSTLHTFITELRILSAPPLRSHRNIVRILGIHWDCFDIECPQPLILLERADYNLRNFQDTFPELPFESKRTIALDVAEGLTALHSNGIIHGDVKVENILVTLEPTLTAKLADFSHSIFDTGETRRLVGGTELYAAPEWMLPAPTYMLRQSDVYSYGIMFSNLMAGFDILRRFEREHGGNTTTQNNSLASIQTLKETGALLVLVKDGVSAADMTYSNLVLDCHLLWNVMDATLQLEPAERSLFQAVQLLKQK